MAIPNLKKKLIIIPKNLVPLPDQRWHTNIFCKEERIHSDAKTGCCETKKTQIANTIFSAFFDDLPSHLWSTCFVTIASIFVWIVLLLLLLPLVPPIPKFVSQTSSTCCKVTTCFRFGGDESCYSLWWKLGIPLLNESGNSSSSSFIRRRMLYNIFQQSRQPRFPNLFLLVFLQFVCRIYFLLHP